ncbi:GNAT family N-acetyltransferase [Nocardioides speluncae]|uniref:GNAT family N-acetyltransferase n=1 Tax=Nocardioides speluncae TaxID=2670337 RepID=UPI000D685FC0|nr:GNAT family N-acetyltransferase [Nocardioides speluncae]
METYLAETPDDFARAAALLVDFNTEYGDPAPPPEWLAGHWASLVEQGTAIVPLIGRPAIGFGVLRLRTSTWSAGLEGYLAELYIRRADRAQGLGTLLLQFVIDQAKARGATYLDLTTTTADESAIALYEKFGFDCHEGKGKGPLSLYYELDL